MKILMVNYSDTGGGAARAGTRLFNALKRSGADVSLVVDRKNTGRYDIDGPKNKLAEFKSIVRPQFAALPNKILVTGNKDHHSAGVVGSGLLDYINDSGADVVNLHWVCNGMLSIKDISLIKPRIVWTQHDMWAFCGAEHYSYDDRWKVGYLKDNRPKNEGMFDLNRWVWRRKVRLWKERDISFVAPSNWMARCIKESAIFCGAETECIFNPIDIDFWRPHERSFVRNILRLPEDRAYVLFGAFGGVEYLRKGFDLLLEAFKLSNFLKNKVDIIILGDKPSKIPDFLNSDRMHFLGFLNDETSLKMALCAADLVVIPSRMDNLPNMAVEAISCGTPVAAFNVGGLTDIVEPGVSGYLAEPFSANAFARAIEMGIDDSINGEMAVTARKFAVSNFDSMALADKYNNFFERILV